MRRAHLVHGIHTSGASPVMGLIPYLTDFDVRYPEYGWIAGLETRIANPIIVGTLLPYIEPDDWIIGHSNGCAIAYDLMNRGARVAGAIFINGALEQKIIRPFLCPKITVYFNAGDEITEAAKIGARLGLTDPVWGQLGHGGYVGSDPEITNIDCGQTPGMPVVSGHSDFFTPSKLAAWGPFLAARVASRLQKITA